MRELSFGVVKPFTPDEAVQNQTMLIPDVVFEAVNFLLAQQSLSRTITIRKDTLIDKIQELGGPDKSTLLANKWLDIEISYRLHGWNVEYESPEWGSSGPGYFTFTRKVPPNVPQPAR